MQNVNPTKKKMAAGDKLFPCGVCAQAVVDDDKAVFCDGCELWHHIACIGLDNHAYEVLQRESDATQWFCPACQPVLNNHSSQNSTNDDLSESLSTSENCGSSLPVNSPKGHLTIFYTNCRSLLAQL